MSSRSHWLRLAATLVLTGACASASRTGTTTTSRAGSSDHLSMTPARYVIARGEIAQVGAISAEELIKRVRPNLLTPRRSRSRVDMTYYTPAVFVDDVRVGGVEALRSYPASILRDVRYLTETEANLRYLGVYPAGVIVLRTRE